MKTQILLVFFAACIAALMPAGGANAKAVECSVARGSHTQGYWSWRLIDGRKCWYLGTTMLSKSLLQCAAKVALQAKADPKPVPVTVVPVTVVTGKLGDPLDAQ